MTRILKFTLDLTERQTLQLPTRARLLSIQPQGCHIRMWFQCTETDDTSPRTFWILGTGQPFPAKQNDLGALRELPLHYHATVQLGFFVWHVYEEIGSERTSSSDPAPSSDPTPSQEREVSGHFCNLG